MKNKIKTNVTNNNMEDKNMQQNENVNAAPAAENVNEAQNNVPTPPVEGQAQASEEKPKKKNIVKKILMIVGAVIALITGGFIAGRVSGKKSDEDYDDTEDNPQITEF